MAKRSISLIDTETETISSQNSRKRRRIQQVASWAYTSLKSWMSPTIDTPKPSRIYPSLPKPYSPSITSADEAGLSKSNPIDVPDSDDEAGPSRSPSPPTKSRPRRRPQLSATDSPARTYEWATESPSPAPSLRKRQATRQLPRKRKSGMVGDIKVKAAASRAKFRTLVNTFGRRKEEQYKATGITEGVASKAAYEKLLFNSEGATLEASISQPKSSYTPSIRRAQASSVQSPDIADILSRVTLEKAASDKLARDSIKPAIPTKLKQEEQAIVDKSFADSGFNRDFVNSTSLRRLGPDIWLDDEIVNHYGTMVEKRSREDPTLPKVFFLNSHFFGKMEQPYTKQFGRWTKKVNIFDMDLLLMPINIGGSHWTATVIDMNRRRIEYYDSMGGRKSDADNIFKKYLNAEHEAKLGSKFDTSDWSLVYLARGTPQQSNGNDCGVFSCQTLENASRGKNLADGQWEFGAKNMQFFRRMMIHEIAEGKLYKRW